VTCAASSKSARSYSDALTASFTATLTRCLPLCTSGFHAGCAAQGEGGGRGAWEPRGVGPRAGEGERAEEKGEKKLPLALALAPALALALALLLLLLLVVVLVLVLVLVLVPVPALGWGVDLESQEVVLLFSLGRGVSRGPCGTPPDGPSSAERSWGAACERREATRDGEGKSRGEPAAHRESTRHRKMQNGAALLGQGLLPRRGRCGGPTTHHRSPQGPTTLSGTHKVTRQQGYRRGRVPPVNHLIMWEQRQAW